jgi:hypothetical protein
MTKFVFIVRQQQETVAGSTQLSWLVVHDTETENLPISNLLQPDPSFEIISGEELNALRIKTQIFCASPNTTANNRSWPFLGQHMTRASRQPVRRSRTSMGVSSFARPNRLK